MQNISEPTLLLDKKICVNNIRRMAEKARTHNLTFKPHMKTHQSAGIGQWLHDEGVRAITVSSVTMAEYFTDNRWKDITIAFPVNLRQLDRINKLASSVSLTLLVDNIDTVKALKSKLRSTVNIYIELDTGSQRTGIHPHQFTKIRQLITSIQEVAHLQWLGFYNHPGQSYSARSKSEIMDTHQSVLTQISDLRAELEPDLGSFEVCIGDTPCCSVSDQFDGINAISPGNFVFYDVMQHEIGSCNVFDIATAVVCPVVEKYSDRNELVIYGGAIHFSKERLSEGSIVHYGKVAVKTEEGWEIPDSKSYLKGLSQEHGIIACSDQIMNSYTVGDLITILPVHSCLTANLMKKYTLLNGELVHQMNT